MILQVFCEGTPVAPDVLVHVPFDSFQFLAAIAALALLGSLVVPFCPFYFGVSLLKPNIGKKRVPFSLRGYWGT